MAESAGRAARRLLARLRRVELGEGAELAREEAQRLLLARHLARLRGKVEQRGGRNDADGEEIRRPIRL